MIGNFIKVAFRNLLKRKFYSTINILGLSIGLTSTILIVLFIQNEMSYDKYNVNHERIYRLESHFSIQESQDDFAATALPLAPALRLEYPQEIEEYCRFMDLDNNLFKYKEKKIIQNDIYYADSTFYKLFTNSYISGSAEKALVEPNSIILTESFAKLIFEEEEALGKTIEGGNGNLFTVTAVIEDLPYNTHMKFNALASMITIKQIFGERYDSLDSQAFWNIGFYSFIMLKEYGAIENVLSDYSRFNDKYIKPVGAQINATFEYAVMPLADVHLKSDVGYDLPTGNITYVYTFGIIALFLLLIGCINYMNLATSQSSNRSLEVGIRKVVGAQKPYLRMQFIFESIVLAFIALIFSLVSVELLLPIFNELSGKFLSFSFIDNYQLLLGMIIVTIIVGIFSGSYPAFFLSSFKPIQVLKGNLVRNRGVLRKILVLMQFSISIIMIIGTFTVILQLNYLKDKDLGFDAENLVVLTVRDTFGVRNIAPFKEELEKSSSIISAGTTSTIPGAAPGIIVHLFETEDGSMKEKGINFIFIDNDYIETMQMNIIKGRNYDKEMQTDANESMLINEATTDVLGWGDDSLGKKLGFSANLDGTANLNTEIIGIVKNFNYASLHNQVDPLLLVLSENPLRNIVLRVKQEDMSNTLSYIESIWNQFCPTFPFEYRFLDDNLNEQYVAELKIGRIFTYFSVLCIFIACLGLFGLASFTVERRSKEISIRKILGASVRNIVFILTKEFSIWVLLANTIAWPVAFYALRLWLQNFAYSVEQSIFIYCLAGLTALSVALITVVFRAYKAATANPADALKYE